MDAESWRWIWLGTSLVFVVGEMASPGSFFLLPFAVGAGVACVAAFAGASEGWQWLAFVLVSGAAFAAFYPLRKRLGQHEPQDGVGARRLLGQTARVLDAIPSGHGESGMVRIGREEWKAESADGRAIDPGAEVQVLEVRGTRVVVQIKE